MPTFNPPLARETTVPITSSDHDRFVHLTFTVSFQDFEDASGSWELWTDIPDVDDEGNLVTGPGEWRSVAYTPPQDMATIASNTQDAYEAIKEGLVMAVPPVMIIPDTLPAGHSLVAHMVVPAHTAPYHYTHRRVLDSGEVCWLGNGSDNGALRIVECESITKNVEQKEWKGVGIELKEDGSAPTTHLLPAKDSVKASILLLQSVPALVQPIHQLLDSPKKSATQDSESLVIVSNDLRPVSIQPNSTSPVAAGLQEHFDQDRPMAQVLADVCKDYKTIQVVTDVADGIVAFFLRPESHSAVGPTRMIIHNTLKKTQVFACPSIPSEGTNKAVAIREVSADRKEGYTFLPADGLGKTAMKHFNNSDAVLVFDVAHFVAMPCKDTSTFQIAGINAINQAIVPNSHQRMRRMSAATLGIQLPEHVNQYLDSLEAADDAEDEEAEAAMLATKADSRRDSDDVPELVTDDSSSSHTGSDHHVEEDMEVPSLATWLKRLFVGIWSWLFGSKSFGEDKAKDDQPASGTVTPNERTRLLSETPQTSAATSSTAVSPYPSPESNSAPLVRSISVKPMRPTAHEEFMGKRWGDGDEQFFIEYHSRFTFAEAPFKFLFAPRSYYFMRLVFEYRRLGESKWIQIPIPCAAHGEEEDCEEVTFDIPRTLDSKDDKTPWETRWRTV